MFKIKFFLREKFLFWFFLFLALFLNFYFRSFPIYFPQLKEEAKVKVETELYNQARDNIEKRFFNFSAFAKDKLTEVYVSEYKRTKAKEIKKSIQEQYFKLKDRYQDKTGQTYLMELDCWHWARYVENVLTKGTPADKIENKKLLDTFMLAPLGTELSWNNFLFYLSASLYRIFSLFKKVELYHFLFYLPLFYSLLFIFFLFLFSYFRWGILSALVSCLFIGLSPIFLARSCAGWFDTDIFNLFLPFLIIWSYLKSYVPDSPKKQILWCFFSSFFLGIFCFTWISWWFILLIILAYELYFLLNTFFLYLQYKIKEKELIKKHLWGLAYFFCFGVFWILFLCGNKPLNSLFSQILQALRLNQPLQDSIWPNVYYTVGELKSANFFDIVNHIGGALFFVLSFLGLLGLFFRYSIRRELLRSFDYNLSIILLIWFMSMFFACSKGIRFSMFLVFPLGISLGWLLSTLFRYTKKNKIFKIGFIILILFFLVKPIQNASKVSRTIFPLIDDTWYELLLELKDNTPSDSIINSWWDFGDWFKVIAKRRVIFDGQSQDRPQAYWMAQILLNKDEEEAIRILKMLNNAGNLAFETINGYLKDPFKSIFLLKRLLKLQIKEAEEILLKYLPKEIAEKVLELIYKEPASKVYFIVEYTMLDKIPAISYLGNWDFLRVYAAKNIFKKKNSQIFSYLKELEKDSKIKEEIYYKEVKLLSPQELQEWLSERFRFYSPLFSQDRKEELVFFPQGIIFDPQKEEIFIYSPSDARYHKPKKLFIFTGDNLIEKNLVDSDFGFSALVLKEDKDYKVVLLDTALVKTLFVHLYFLDAKFLKHFKPFLEKKEYNRYIKVFEVVW